MVRAILMMTDGGSIASIDRGIKLTSTNSAEKNAAEQQLDYRQIAKEGGNYN
jgi:hypothetical protein